MPNPIQFIRGDTYVVNIAVQDSLGEPYIPQMEDTVTMTVRQKDHRGVIVIQKKTGDADVVVTETGWIITIQPSDTSGLPYRDYVYDIQLEMGDVVQTIIPMSKFILNKEVTY